MMFFGEAKELATLFEIQPTRANLRRIERAIEIVDAKQVTFIGQHSHLREYEVYPQGGNPKMRGTGQKYTVHSSGDNYPRCDCPDWRKPTGKPFVGDPAHNLHRCKHGIAVLLVERYKLGS